MPQPMLGADQPWDRSIGTSPGIHVGGQQQQVQSWCVGDSVAVGDEQGRPFLLAPLFK